MRLVLQLVIVLAVLWAAGWFVLARLVERGAETWFAEQERDGWVAGYTALGAGGFPGRITLSLEQARMIDPGAGNGWEAPALRLTTVASQPAVVQVEAPAPQRAWIAGTPVEITGILAGALRPGWLGGAQEARIEGRELRLSGPGGWLDIARLDTLLRATEAGQRVELSIALEDLVPDPASLPEVSSRPIERMAMAGMAELAPDRFGDMLIERLTLDRAQIDWAAARLSAEGSVARAADGLAEGRITFRAQDWRPWLDLAVATGIVRAELAPTWARVFRTLQTATGGTGALELPLVFRSGRMSLGPLPLGPAPRLGPPDL